MNRDEIDRIFRQVAEDELSKMKSLGAHRFAICRRVIPIGLPCTAVLFPLGVYLMGWSLEDVMSLRGASYLFLMVVIGVVISYWVARMEYEHRMKEPPE